MTVLSKGSLSNGIHAGINRAIGKRFLRSLTGFHNSRHGADTEKHRHQTGSEGPATVKENSQENRQTGHGKTDDGNVIDGQMQMSGSKEGLDHPARVTLRALSRKRENGHAGQNCQFKTDLCHEH